MGVVPAAEGRRERQRRATGEPCPEPALESPARARDAGHRLWLDTEYSASAFASARAKAQRLRHNIQEIAAWGPLQCHHVHDETEWTPVQVDGVTVYPSAEVFCQSSSVDRHCGVMVGGQNGLCSHGDP